MLNVDVQRVLSKSTELLYKAAMDKQNTDSNIFLPLKTAFEAIGRKERNDSVTYFINFHAPQWRAFMSDRLIQCNICGSEASRGENGGSRGENGGSRGENGGSRGENGGVDQRRPEGRTEGQEGRMEGLIRGVQGGE